MHFMIKKLHLQGSAKEIGFLHGSQGKQEVMNSLKAYERLFYVAKKMSWQEAREHSLLHLNAIEKYDFQMIEEMEGIAEGAGVDFEDILTLNARSEIALTNIGEVFSDGCTSMAVSSPIIKDTIIGQTWDWTASQKNSLLLLDIEAKNAPLITMVTEGGIIGKIGFNSAGVGFCLNALVTDKGTNKIPLHLGYRAVLNSYSQAEAISKISNGQIAASGNFLIGYDDGNGNGMTVNLEVSPFGIDYVGGDDGWLTHTNHICSNVIKQYVNDVNDVRFEDSILRKKRADQLIKASIAAKEPINEQTFERWLSDTLNKPSSINHFENENAPEYRKVETIFSIIMNLSERRALLRVGQEGTFEEIDNISAVTM
ncbi:C45 family autoproteolytic acyltransferase/hydolase [Siminovitchia fortis]|uniref:C45 family autoproteolytic acyltransferase/hydolase n=2 Tax=Siminovitchia fortis TaxID=254758 RepID=UPI0021B2896C|nr:C45 family peptidase [Siminovitchia fortis]